ncbi:right-handed parallel beta-helix repeat-containing protein [Thalassotalea sp. HSM 43]|uniref:right-handed parallel beta-helix repeat-containing protein n=1 Tax=Thalassotalea sp. HSM 43 TaxID=2552945 RepID=UPI001080438C|nr:right-handed parallel beta-helix repeat-containing protein [Thalassotalea sp. HSM 43]QBY04239.1 right-handed parallel beta-helix repeat-containing protein [Thalassotalea sp. HSM 43]
MRIILLTMLFALTSQFALAETYYVDSHKGNDNNSGTQKNKAWKSIYKVNQQTFKAGDKVLFKSGSVFTGALEPKGNGEKNKPIIIDSYGKGAKPKIHGQGWKQHTLLLKNIEYWQVNNLFITNLGKQPQPRRTGVTIEANNIGELHGIVLNKLIIGHINGVLKKKQGGGHGILVRSTGDETQSRFIDLQLTNNYIHNSARNGIGFKGYANRKKWFPSLGVIIRGNLIEKVPGDGIVVVGTDGALIEGNILRDFPDTLPEGDAAAGIWPWSADNTLVQYNEVSGHKAKWDGQGFDADWNSVGTIIQHNYSHDNYGGFLLVCNNGNKYKQDINIGTLRTIVRGNVSVNDGIRPYPTFKGMFSPTFHLTGPIEDTQIYDNLIIIPKKGDKVDNTLVEMDNWGGPWPINTLFENNQIYFEDELQIKLKDIKDVLFKKNHFSKTVANFDATGNTVAASNDFDLPQLMRLAQQKLDENNNYE